MWSLVSFSAICIFNLKWAFKDFVKFGQISLTRPSPSPSCPSVHCCLSTLTLISDSARHASCWAGLGWAGLGWAGPVFMFTSPLFLGGASWL